MSVSSRIVDRAIANAGLDQWLARRIEGKELEADRAFIDAATSGKEVRGDVRPLDILILGALADRVRAAECGQTVRVHLRRPTAPSLPSFDPVAGGIVFLRAVARARLLGAKAARVVIDIDDVGLQLAQVCLAFGATELIAPQKKRSIVVDAEGDAFARAVLAERELAALVVSAGRAPIIVEVADGAVHERAVDDHSAVKKKFRAPGRERDVSSEGDPS